MAVRREFGWRNFLPDTEREAALIGIIKALYPLYQVYEVHNLPDDDVETQLNAFAENFGVDLRD